MSPPFRPDTEAAEPPGEGFEDGEKVIARWTVDGSHWKAYVDHLAEEEGGRLLAGAALGAALFGIATFVVGANYVVDLRDLTSAIVAGGIAGAIVLPLIGKIRLESRRRQRLGLGGSEVRMTHGGVRLVECQSRWVRGQTV